MLKSMTGYGKATGTANEKKISVELRSLNSKGLDLNIKLPSLYREKEIEVRNLLSGRLIRGKVDFLMQYENAQDDKKAVINMPLAMAYYRQLWDLGNKIDNSASFDYLSAVMSMPEVLQSAKPELEPGEWEQVLNLISEAVQNLEEFRKTEGQQLEQDMLERVKKIQALRLEVQHFAPERLTHLRQRLEKNLQELKTDEGFDQNRLEQELIFYLEKFDITEENIRLNSHCEYFLQTASAEENQGKKLGFILQEMGREINTMGSKASHVAIQKLVVQMKDELEKIKEQVLNIV